MWLGGNLRVQVLEYVRGAIRASTLDSADMRIVVTGKHTLPSAYSYTSFEIRWQFPTGSYSKHVHICIPFHVKKPCSQHPWSHCRILAIMSERLVARLSVPLACHATLRIQLFLSEVVTMACRAMLVACNGGGILQAIG